MPRIRVLVVDDSAFMRKIITNILAESPDIEVIGKARNGQEAIEKVTDLKPDVVTMDLEMPGLDGLHALGYIMSECPTPVIMLSGAESNQADVTMTAFQYGAVDFILKPSGNISLDMAKIKDEIVKKVKAASSVQVRKLGFIEEEKKSDIVEVKSLKEKNDSAKKSIFHKIIVIGSSTGGPRALQQVIPLLPSNLHAPVLVVQHMPPGFTKSLADRLNSISSIKVREAEDGDILQSGTVYIAPGDFHMIIKQQKINGDLKDVIALTKGVKVQGVRPSIDVLLNSVAPIFGQNSLGVILTGMGSDGTDGIRKLKLAGGKVMAEEESTCVVYGMPRSVIEQKLADYILPIGKIAENITQIT
ncbi:MAG: chemotaxis response regulator protein-glutamate methylesterase [Candidatus Methanoperedenaceae archaeon]|nr:MAG: chemotaxis response regulator protein-glutamate methylesterase [Candidatus Methanoperedenaceae archaeon]